MTDKAEGDIKSRIEEARKRGAWAEVVALKIEEVTTRGAKKRGWVVLRKSFLTSSINYRMEGKEQIAFVKLILMADELGPVPGLISDNDCRAMPIDYLSRVAFCPLDVFKATIEKCVADDSIYENSHGLFLTHFDDYQFTEYDRQKPYRQAQREKKRQEKGLSLEDAAEVNAENARSIAARDAAKKRK